MLGSSVKLAPVISAVTIGGFEKRSDRKHWFTVHVIPADFDAETINAGSKIKRPYVIYRTQEDFSELSLRLGQVDHEFPAIQFRRRNFLLISPSPQKVRDRLDQFVRKLFQNPVMVLTSPVVLEFFGLWDSDIKHMRKQFGTGYPDFEVEDENDTRFDSAIDLSATTEAKVGSPEKEISFLDGFSTRHSTISVIKPILRRARSAMLGESEDRVAWPKVGSPNTDEDDDDDEFGSSRPGIVAPWNLRYMDPVLVQTILPPMGEFSCTSSPTPTPASPIHFPPSSNLRRSGTIGRGQRSLGPRTLRKATSTNSLSAAAAAAATDELDADSLTFIKVKAILNDDTIVILRVHRSISYDDLYDKILLKFRLCGQQADDLMGKSLVYRLTENRAFFVSSEEELQSALMHECDKITFYLVSAHK
ncbi:hypothetical protein K493DRAFT_349271 [Basidiobolus meristosporus CBS 931.73]|uniref:PB1 domain-containing protein n=1 Tax=Basidiobolus meristosporus CBS 931.73 TaxID=1314790 RepID=A0A1Y1YL43_9FUNG|nr:hypothetical protein K493DRAFT_349271 [Basidiobolus meristosporus CBS 931.73]|eukprot:ORX98476.1 hypothetical protein K493DRAFT_349271 [Basidiobolus meristosporus CBS 931.73]